MRMVFGLVGLLGLLIGVAVVVKMQADNAGAVSKTYKKVQPQVQQMSGHGADGRSALESAALDEENDGGGKFHALGVKDVTAGGAYQTYFGLQKGDAIVEVGGARIGDFELADPETAKARVFDAFQRGGSILVDRGGARMKLPK